MDALAEMARSTVARYVLSDGRELETPDGDIGAAYVELAVVLEDVRRFGLENCNCVPCR